MPSTSLSRRAFLSGAALTAVAFRADPLRALAPVTSVTLRTPLGRLLGEESGGVRVFRGVPFAEPPVGRLRFRPTVPLRPWTAVRDATHFAASAMQMGEPGTAHSEDCLYLNIWTPAEKGPHPVYVWFHGGGFTAGHSFLPVFDGTELARQGILCVTVGYRLGVLGFLDLGPLLGSEYDGSANNALRDLIAALEWVQHNIDCFGGDPSRVTIGGQSAGAKLTDVLMGVPSARPLFHQMISESGGAERLWSLDDSRAVSEGFGRSWRENTDKPLSALTTAPAAEIMEVQRQFTKSWPRHFPLRMEIDGTFLPRLPVETIAEGSTRGKRLLIGTNRDESAAFIGPHPAHDADASNLGNMHLPQFLRVYHEYAKIYPQMTVEQRRIRALTAEEYWVPSIRVAEAHVKGGGEAWMYRLDFHEGSGLLGAFAFHSLELRLVWDHPLRTIANASTELELAGQMHEAWCAFLRGGTPAAPGLPEWPQYRSDEHRTMILNERSRVKAHPQEAELRLWNGEL
ncbi:MAG TPA: carboxylesterase family protein [Terracidiphilus sp.]